MILFIENAEKSHKREQKKDTDLLPKENGSIKTLNQKYI